MREREREEKPCREDVGVTGAGDGRKKGGERKWVLRRHG